MPLEGSHSTVPRAASPIHVLVRTFLSWSFAVQDPESLVDRGKGVTRLALVG